MLGAAEVLVPFQACQNPLSHFLARAVWDKPRLLARVPPANAAGRCRHGRAAIQGALNHATEPLGICNVQG